MISLATHGKSRDSHYTRETFPPLRAAESRDGDVRDVTE